MASIKDFENNIAVLNNDELYNYDKALNTLKTWELFESNFGYSSSLAVLRSIVSNEITSRSFSEGYLKSRCPVIVEK